MEAGVKLGIKYGAIGGIADSMKRIKSQDYSRSEGLVNAYFAGKEGYEKFLSVLADKNNSGMGTGAWAYGKYNLEQSTIEQTEPIVTEISIKEMLKSDSEELRIAGTRIEAYNAYMKAKKLTVEPAESTSTFGHKSISLDAEIPLTGSFPPSFASFVQNSNEYKRLALNARIHVYNNLVLEVDGHADIRGLFLHAKSLEAFFNSLVLASVQDLMEHKEFSAGISLSLHEVADILKSLSATVGTGKRHVVRELTALIGEEKAHVIVQHALKINGAMIASAQINGDGTYTDHGNLVLTVGELFVQHIHDYDNGYTLGMAVNGISYDLENVSTSPTFGMHKSEGETKATIGKGKVTCTKSDGVCEIEKANRDVDIWQYLHEKYNIQPVTAYFSNTDIQFDWEKDTVNVNFSDGDEKDITIKTSKLSKISYEDPQDIKNEIISNEVTKNMDLIGTSGESGTGYFGFATREKNTEGGYTYTFTHRGTDSWGDIFNNLSIFIGTTPTQLQDAKKFEERIKEAYKISMRDKIIHTGHSAGGALAQHLNLRNHNEDYKSYAIAFDSPGIKVSVDALVKSGSISKEALDKTLKTTTIYTMPQNLINFLGEHLVTPNGIGSSVDSYRSNYLFFKVCSIIGYQYCFLGCQ